ncbi:MAG: hypothetical protein HY678_09810 [Chloroflexi bacterium]|nr:hypothetical protein [Chloroflexota bacterium]
MLYLKACPRCHGDVKFERDMYGHYLECLQCGFIISSKLDEKKVKTEAGAKAA